MKIAIVCIVKNEVDYMLEWIAYHRSVLDVTDFIVADNVSNDGTTQLLEALDQAGLIKRIHFPRVDIEKGIQADAYNHILKKYGGKYDYLAFIDADEFIVNKTGLDFKGLLKKIAGQRSCGAIALNWKIFGSSGNYYQTNSLVTERFTWASRSDHKLNRHIKSILKPSCVKSMYIHHAKLVAGKYYFDEGGKTTFINNIKEKDELAIGSVSAFTQEIKNDDFYVAHYVVKSKDEHMRKKAKRGSAAGPAARQKGMGYFKGHDLNQLICNDLSYHAESVKSEISIVEDILKENSLFYCPLRTHIDRFDSMLVGWVALQGNEDITIKLLINGIEEVEYKLTVFRPDVILAGVSVVDKCGFSIDLSSFDKKELRVWIKGSNAILWDGSKGY